MVDGGKLAHQLSTIHHLLSWAFALAYYEIPIALYNRENLSDVFVMDEEASMCRLI